MKRPIRQQGEIEDRYQRPFREVLVYLYNLKGARGAAAELGVSRSTFSYWLLREGIKTRSIAE